MDRDRFDQFARWIGASNRRQVLGGALAGAAAALSGAAGADTVAKRNKVKGEGPCGNGRIKDNRCRRNRQCCTGYCDQKKGKKPYGRCRCRKLNQTCQEDRNCCATAGQPMTCVDGTCQTMATSCVLLGGACTTGGAACCTDVGAAATCTSGICRDPEYCATTLEAAGCGFSPTEMIWFCTGQYLNGANLSGCDLTGANFRIADATNVSFVSTILTGATFAAGTVTGAVWDNTTCPSGANSDASGDTCCGEFILGQVPTGCEIG